MNTIPDPEPTPEFYARCQAIFEQWEAGDLPFKEAVDQMTALGREAAQSGHLANQGRVELLLGILQGYRANLDASITHFERARDLFERAGNRRRAIGCVLNLGETYRLKGNFSRARQLFRAAYDGAKELGAVDTQTIAAYNEGQLLMSMEHYESARVAIEKAHTLADLITQRPDQRLNLLCETEASLALVHLHLKQTAHAWDYAWRALQQARDRNQPIQLGVANRAMGEVLSALGELPPEADPSLSSDPDEYFRIANEAFQEIKAEGELARTMYAQAMSLAARGKGMTAARKLQQAMIIFTKLGMTDDAAKAAHAQSDVLSNAQDN